MTERVRRECVIVGVTGVVLAAVMTWPTLAHPGSTVPEDIFDPLLQAWQVAWGGHALRTDPGNVWDSNTFFPQQDTLAYSDSLLGYAPAGLFGSGPVAALVRYNLLFVLAHALAFVGMYALCRQLGARWAGAAVAGAAFAYAPWRWAHAGHLNILSVGGIALALAMLARGHGFRLTGTGAAPPRWGWVLGGWLVAAWQVTLGFGLGIPFATVLGALILGAAVWLVYRRIRLPRAVALANLGGFAAFCAVALAMVVPYLRVADEHPYARRTVADLEVFSPPFTGFFAAPEDSTVWGGRTAGLRDSLVWPPEMTLLVGWTLILLAALGLFVSAWSRRARLLLAGGTVLSVILAMGTEFPGGGRYTYLVLYHALPGWDASRTPGRLVVWTTLLLGVLAAGALTALAERARHAPTMVELLRYRPVLPALLALPALLVLIEGRNTTPHPEVPTVPAAVTEAAEPLLILPSDQLADQISMYWSTDGFPRIANGGSGIIPHQELELRGVAAAFPDQASVDYLRGRGIRSVVVLRDRIAGTPFQSSLERSVDGLGVTREDAGEAVVFTL